MASSLRRLPSILQDIDLVIEVRDARLPLTSVNPAFEQALSRAWGYQSVSAGRDRKGKGRETGMGIKEKVVVYTKRDLAERRYEEVRPQDRMIEIDRQTDGVSHYGKPLVIMQTPSFISQIHG